MSEQHVITVALVQNEVGDDWQAGDPRGWSWAAAVGEVGPIVSGSGCATADEALDTALDGYAGGASGDRVRVLYDPFVYRVPDNAAARGIEGVEFPMTRSRIFASDRDAEIMGDALARGKPKRLRALRERMLGETELKPRGRCAACAEVEGICERHLFEACRIARELSALACDLSAIHLHAGTVVATAVREASVPLFEEYGRATWFRKAEA